MVGKPNLRNMWGSEQFDKRLDLSVNGSIFSVNSVTQGTATNL